MTPSNPLHQGASIEPFQNGYSPQPFTRVPFHATATGFGDERGALPPALVAPPGVADLLKALRRHWAMAIVLGLLTSVSAAAAAWVLMPTAKYTARTMLRAAATTPRVLAERSDIIDRDEFRTYQQTQQTLIKSRLVLDDALRQESVARLAIVRDQVDPVAWLEKLLEISFEGEIMQISARGDRPDELRDIVNAVTKSYLERVVNVEHQSRRERYNRLKDVFERYQEALRTKRQTLKKLAETVGSKDRDTLTLKHQFAIEHHSLVEKELLQVKSELRRAELEHEMELKHGRDATSGHAEAPSIDHLVTSDPNVQKYREQIAQFEWRVAQATRVSRNPKSDPSFQRDRMGLDAARRAMKDYVASLKKLHSAPTTGANDPVAKSARQVEFLKNYEKVMQAEVAKLAEGTRFLYQTTTDLEALQDELLASETAAKRVGEQMENLSVELEAPDRIHLIELAEAPRMADGRKRVLATGGLAFGSMAATLLGIAFWDFRHRRVDSVDNIVHGLGMRLIGALPAWDERARRGRTHPALSGRLIASIDSVRALVLHMSRVDSLHVLMVTSAGGGEGKTFLSSNLAASLARAGRRTLLLDFDLRNPSIHEGFDLPLGPGLCELLRGETRPSEIVLSTPAEGLFVITAGRADPRALEALAMTNLQALLNSFRGQYDFIVIDSAPVLPVPDSLLIGQHVDGVIVSTLKGVSRGPRVYAACERMAALNIRNLGVVISGIRDTGTDADYRYTRPMELS